MEWDVKEVVDEYSDTVYRLAISRTQNISDAQDVFQEVFLRFMNHKDKVKDKEHLKAWLIRVTINCSKTLLNSFWNRKTEGLTEILLEDDKEDLGVYEALLRLPINYGTVLYLFYYEEYSLREIAAIMGCKEGTVKSRLNRGRIKLKEMLEGVVF